MVAHKQTGFFLKAPSILLVATFIASKTPPIGLLVLLLSLCAIVRCTRIGTSGVSVAILQVELPLFESALVALRALAEGCSVFIRFVTNGSLLLSLEVGGLLLCRLFQ